MNDSSNPDVQVERVVETQEAPVRASEVASRRPAGTGAVFGAPRGFLTKAHHIEGVPMKINETWHRRNPMPKEPTLDQRIAWHLEHAQHCACREIPQKLKEEIARRGRDAHARAESSHDTGAPS